MNLDALVSAGDLDEILRVVDRLSDDREWAELDRLRRQCRQAHERGHQLWPAAANASYRLALDGPADLACAVVEADDTVFSLGPLTEVLAQNHSWDDLAPHLRHGPRRVAVAQERVLRGEDLTGQDVAPTDSPAPLDLPLNLAAWEQTSNVAYRSNDAEFPAPTPTALTTPNSGAENKTLAEDSAVTALRHLVSTWVEQSAGRAHAVSIEGRAEDAIATLKAPGARTAEGSLSSATEIMMWAASSGGSHGRRRGGAAARFDVWWALAALTNSTADWPLSIAELSEYASELRWVHWHDAAPVQGWELHLAIEDPADGLAWAIAAQDTTLD